jgi:hypothetical protein
MKPELLNDLNSLFCLLTEFDVVQRVREHYAQYHNPAPPALLQEQINKLEKHINEAYKPKRTKEMKPYFVVNVCYLCREGITFHLDKTSTTSQAKPLARPEPTSPYNHTNETCSGNSIPKKKPKRSPKKCVNSTSKWSKSTRHKIGNRLKS